MTRQLRFALVATGLLATLSGCGNRDPYRRDDVWYPTGANAANLAAMVANPNDLVSGRHDDRMMVGASSKSVTRIWNDTPKSLTGTGGGGGGSALGSGGTGNTGGSGSGDPAGGIGGLPGVPSIPGLSGGG